MSTTPVINFNSNRSARPPRARKLHVTLEYLCGRTLPFSTLMTNWLQNSLCATSLSPTVGSQIFLFVSHDSHEQQNLPPSWNLSKQTSFSAWSQCVRSNAWLLSYERSTNENTRSCSQKSVEKRVEWRNTCQQVPEKDQSYVKVKGNDALYIKMLKLKVRLWCSIPFHCHSELHSMKKTSEDSFLKKLFFQNLSC